jgi:uncharacterized membrane protein YedE/YeeE
MQIDWTLFTPWSALAGGLLIGLAAAILILWNGRILGMSGLLGGLLGGLLRPQSDQMVWRVMILGGMATAAWLSPLILPWIVPTAWLTQPTIEADTVTIIIAGLLVGWSTRYGSGCTSGHGICGLSRRSPRSLVFTFIFMLSGGLTVYILRSL